MTLTQSSDTTASLPVTTATRPLPPAVPATPAFASNSFSNTATHSLLSPCDTTPSPSPSGNARYIPKSFIYNTPLNHNTLGAVYDSGYSSLSSRSANYHSPSAPATPPSPNSPTELTPCERYLELYKSGSLEARKAESSRWELKCTICEKWIQSSIPTRRPLSIPNHFSVLEGHSRSRTCIARPARASTAPPIPSPRKSSSSGINEVPSDDEDDDDRSSSLPPEASSRSHPAPTPMVVVQTCPGSLVHWPVNVGSFMETFPFHRPWNKNSRHLRAMHGRSTTRWLLCALRQDPAEVQKLVDLALQADSRINHRYLSWSQIRNLLADRTEEARKWRLKSLNAARNFATAVRRLAFTLISVGFRRGSSPSALIRMIQSSLEGVYQPRPVLDSRTLDIALLVFRLGGVGYNLG
ncbi:hypothetical protein R3P38DRAFT_3222624 [Favolaschia claudopus]|uniref:Uncharacterized protein n=1 Tax=Favolaschia claudopus TaxID=2862362 RepID=A0AAV9ZYF9_9AGAR